MRRSDIKVSSGVERRECSPGAARATITTQYKLLRVLGITGTLSEVMN